MCEANVFILKGEKEEKLIESVDIIEPLSENEWYLKNIFGEQTRLEGHIKHISLINHKIVFEVD